MDDTFSLLKGEAIRRFHIKVVRLIKNFSLTAALSVGFDLAEGDTIENLARYIIRASFYQE